MHQLDEFKKFRMLVESADRSGVPSEESKEGQRQWSKHKKENPAAKAGEIKKNDKVKRLKDNHESVKEGIFTTKKETVEKPKKYVKYSENHLGDYIDSKGKPKPENRQVKGRTVYTDQYGDERWADNHKSIKEGTFANKIFNNGLTPDRHNITGKDTKCKNCGYDLRKGKDGKLSHANFRDDANCKNPVAESTNKMQKCTTCKGSGLNQKKGPAKNPNCPDCKGKGKVAKKTVAESKGCCSCKNCKCDCHK